MQAYALICRDHPNSLELRKKTRAAHLAYLRDSGVHLFLGGPLLSENHEPIGSLIIIEVENQHAADVFAHNDPYAKAGLFQSVEIKPYTLGAGSLLTPNG